MKTAYIVKAYRTAVGKAPKGVFRFKRADELGAETIQHMMKELPNLDVKRIDDVIVGNAMPEGAQGLNMARFISLIGLDSVDVPGVTVNRFCSSGIRNHWNGCSKNSSRNGRLYYCWWSRKYELCTYDRF